MKEYSREELSQLITSQISGSELRAILYHIENFGREVEELNPEQFRARKPRNRVRWTVDEAIVVLDYINQVVGPNPQIIKENDLVANCRRVGLTSEIIAITRQHIMQNNL